jgi:outer membrane protein assembly factor BamA
MSLAPRGRPRRVLAVVAAMLLSIGLAAAGAQAPADQAPYGQTVVSVVFSIEGQPATLPALTALVDVRVGEPLTADRVRTSINRLATRYEDVITEADIVEGGVAVTFHLTPRHPIDRIDVQGDSGPTAEDLRQRILQRYGGVLPAAVRPDVIADQAVDILRDEGYLDATVAATTVPRHEPEGATLVLTVSAGVRATIARTEVTGRSPLSAETVRKRTAAVPGAPYRRRALDTALADLRDELSRQHYYEALTTHRAERTPEGVVLTITVEAGPRVDLGIEPPGALPDSTGGVGRP